MSSPTTFVANQRIRTSLSALECVTCKPGAGASGEGAPYELRDAPPRCAMNIAKYPNLARRPGETGIGGAAGCSAWSVAPLSWRATRRSRTSELKAFCYARRLYRDGYISRELCRPIRHVCEALFIDDVRTRRAGVLCIRIS